MDPAIAAFGLGVGVLVGMTGIGGGSLMTPLLILVFGIKPVTAVGTDLAYGAVTKTVGGWRHLRQGTVDMSLSMWMAVGSVPAAVGGVYILELLENAYGDEFDDILIVVLAITLLFTGIVTLTRALFLKALRDKERHSIEMTRRNKISAAVLGALVGFVLGVTSAGSGALIAVGLIMLFRLVPSRVVGPHRRRQRRLQPRRQHPDRLGAGGLDRLESDAASRGRGAAHDAGVGADGSGAGAADKGGRRDPGSRDCGVPRNDRDPRDDRD